MLGLDRRAARYAWTVLFIVVAVAVVFFIRRTIFIFAAALLFAYLLSPLVNFLDRFLPTRSRTPALALAYVIVVSILVLFIIEVGSRAFSQAQALALRIPELIAQLGEPTDLPLPQPVRSVKETVLLYVGEQVKARANDIVSALPQAGLRVISAAGNLVLIVVIPILSFFFLKDGRSMRRQLIESVAEGPKRELVRGLLLDMHVLLAQYMRALFIIAAATFAFYGAFFLIIGMPYGMLLATIAFVLEFIPMIGPLTAAAAIVLVAGFSGVSIIGILLFLIAYRMFQDYVMQPYLLGAGVKIHPALVIFGVFAGGEIAGVAGTFLSIPTIALLRIVYRRIMKTHPEPAAAELVEKPT